MEDSSERSPLLFFLLLLRHSSFFFASLARIYAYSDFGIVLSLFLFLLRAALGRSPLTLHCSFSLTTNLAYPSSSRAPTCPLYLLSLSFSSLLSSTLSLASRTLGPRRSRAHALLFSLARAACFPLSTDSCDRRSLQFGRFSLRRVVARVGRGSSSVSNCHIVPRRLSACFPRGENCDRENASRSVKPRSISR